MKLPQCDPNSEFVFLCIALFVFASLCFYCLALLRFAWLCFAAHCFDFCFALLSFALLCFKQLSFALL